MSADLIHKGHLKIIDEGAKLGLVIVGLLIDKAIAGYKRLPLIAFDERKLIVEKSLLNNMNKKLNLLITGSIVNKTNLNIT